MKTYLALALAACVAVGAAFQTPAAKTAAPQTDAEVIRIQKPSYPLEICLVSGEKLDETSVDAVIDGRLVRLCCNDCKPRVEKEKANFWLKLDEAVVRQQGAKYPLKTCPVSGKALDDKAVDVVRGTRLVRLCCNDCKSALDAKPADAMAKVDKAWIEAQLPSYPLDTCVVSDEKLGSMGEPVNVLYGTRLVRLCCSGCKKTVEKEGPAMIAKIDVAFKEAAARK